MAGVVRQVIASFTKEVKPDAAKQVKHKNQMTDANAKDECARVASSTCHPAHSRPTNPNQIYVAQKCLVCDSKALNNAKQLSLLTAAMLCLA